MNPVSDFSCRLTPLNDGRIGLRSGMHIEIRDNSCNSCLDFISSDESLDRYNEVISVAGWRLDNYRQNPVFQNAHQYGDILHTLGKALSTEVRSGKLFQTVEFATDINPIAKIAYSLYKGKFLNAVSVGFVPVRWENGTEKTAYSRKFLEQELLEVSAVAIPANPNALALGIKSGSVEKSDLKDVVDLFRATLSGSREAISLSASGAADEVSVKNKSDCGRGEVAASIHHPESAHLLRMLQTLNKILKS